MFSLSITPVSTNFSEVANLGTKDIHDACDEVGEVMTDYERKLRAIRSALNTSNAVAPILTTLLKRRLAPAGVTNLAESWMVSKEMKAFVEDMMRLGYLELVGLE